MCVFVVQYWIECCSGFQSDVCGSVINGISMQLSAYSSLSSLQADDVSAPPPSLFSNPHSLWIPLFSSLSSPSHWPTFPLTCFRKVPHTPKQNKKRGGKREKEWKKDQRREQSTAALAKSHLAFVLASALASLATTSAACEVINNTHTHTPTKLDTF